MAERRMFSKKVIDTDEFLEMPISARLLYYDLSMRADDDGFVASPKKLTRMVGCSEDDAKLLVEKQFIILFDSGVCVIRHWRVHNYIQKDRYRPTQYNHEKSLLNTDLNGVYTKCIQNVSNLDTQDRLELGKSKDRVNTPLTPHGGNDSGESLSVETATGKAQTEKESACHSTTRRRSRKRTGVLDSRQQKMFDAFWDAYPNKKSSGQAEKTFAQINPDENLLSEILAGVERAKKYDSRFKDNKYTPYPSSWLNSKGWQDKFTEEGFCGSNSSDAERDSEQAKKWGIDTSSYI